VSSLPPALRSRGRIIVVPFLARVRAARDRALSHAREPTLFALIGAAVDVTALRGDRVRAALGVLAAGLAVRLPVTYAAVGGAGLTSSERALIVVAWLPKAPASRHVTQKRPHQKQQRTTTERSRFECV